MKFSEYLKPAIGVIVVAAVGVYYWLGHRPRPEEKDIPANALVIVTKSTNACFSDLVRVTGFIVPRREAVVGVDQEGSRVSEVLVREGDIVTDNQELARLTPPPRGGQPGGRPGPTVLRAPAPGLVTEVRTAAGAPASPQAGPMFRISIDDEIELDAEVPAIHMLKLNPGASARVSRDNVPDLIGRVRQVSPQIDRATQLGHIRISLTNNPSLIGMFTATLNAKRQAAHRRHTASDHSWTTRWSKGTINANARVKIVVFEAPSRKSSRASTSAKCLADAGQLTTCGADTVKTMFAEELDRTRVR